MAHQLKKIMEKLESCIVSELERGIEKVDTKELGEAIDMLKDISKAMYNMSVIEAMEEYSEDEEDGKMYYGGRGRRRASRDSRGRYMSRRGYDEMFPIYDDHSWTRDMDREGMGRMYYTNQTSNNSRDSREGRSGMSRKGYMESKEMNKSEMETKKELEEYMKELGSDIAEMVSTATPAEKAMLKQKMTEIQSKIM